MPEPVKNQSQQPNQLQQVNNTKVLPMSELTQEELLHINGAGARRGLIRTDMFVL